MASRFEILRKEINRGLNIDEKSGSVITNWTPNNVRRLILGSDCAIVSYHVTGGKFNSLMKIVDFGTNSMEEFMKVSSGELSTKPLLSVLVDGRICSCIEEIVFCTSGYDSNMLSFDSDLSVLLTKKSDITASSLHSRFPRLNSIYKLNCSVQEICGFVRDAKSANTLLHSTLVENKKDNLIAEFNAVSATWWKGSYLRPQLYAMDADDSPLSRRFQGVENYYLNLERDIKVAKAEVKKYEAVRAKFLPEYSSWSKVFYSLSEGCASVTNICSLIEKTVWASLFDNRAVSKNFSKYVLFKDKEKYQLIDFNTLRKVLLAIDGQEDSNVIDVSFLTLFYNLIEYGKLEVVKEIGDDVKRREYLSVNDSYVQLKKGVRQLLIIYASSILAGLIKNVGSNGVKYASTNYSRLTNIDASVIEYDEGFVESINRFLPEDINAGEVLRAIGATRLKGESNKGPYRVKSALAVLDILEKKE